VFSARIAGTVNARPKLLVGPCVYARCRIREMGEGFLDQRDLKIMATTVEHAPQSDHPSLRREFRLLGSKIPCGAPEGRGLGRVVPRAQEEEGDVEESASFTAANHLPRSPRISIRSSGTWRRSRSG